MPFVLNDGARIDWRIQGSARNPVVLLLNGIGTDQTLYDFVAPDLLRDHRLLRLDTRGHGASDAPAGDYNLELLAADVLAVMDAAEVRSAVICGLSLGGMIAMTLALAAPGRVNALMLACTSAQMDPEFWSQRIATVRREGVGSIVEAALGRLLSTAFARANPAILDTLRSGLRTMSPDGYAGCGAAIRDMELVGWLESIRAPTLVLGAAADTATPFEGHGSRIVSGIPGAQFAIMPTGHLACIEDPRTFAAVLRRLIPRAA
jgi:3-oxoadipate enol-lactonase/4-carboxymuconolactone decarboxylase